MMDDTVSRCVLSICSACSCVCFPLLDLGIICLFSCSVSPTQCWVVYNVRILCVIPFRVKSMLLRCPSGGAPYGFPPPRISWVWSRTERSLLHHSKCVTSCLWIEFATQLANLSHILKQAEALYLLRRVLTGGRSTSCIRGRHSEV